MYRWIGWLLLLPLTIAYMITTIIAVKCAFGGGLWRLLGVLVSLVIGGIFIWAGHAFAFVGFHEWEAGGYQIITYPVPGWIIMIGGGIIALRGTWISLREGF